MIKFLSGQEFSLKEIFQDLTDVEFLVLLGSTSRSPLWVT